MASGSHLVVRHEQADLLVTLLAHRHEATLLPARSAVDLDQMFRPSLPADFHHGLKANAFCERVIGTLRGDWFDHIIVKDEHHAQRVLHNYLAHYHGRPHRGLRMQPPDGAKHLPPCRPPKGTRILATPILGGLHHRYGFAVPARAPPSEEACAA